MSGGTFQSPAQLAAALNRGGKEAVSAAEIAMRHGAKALVVQVQRNASGRPGPRVITGKYRASWQSDVHRAGPVIIAEVGTSAPQGRRLEFGFVGVDSLGRHYNQPPFPHLGPAVNAFGPLLVREMHGAVSRTL
ncbi:HK97 gp10 family phage protein [Streptomyces sp. S.PB5]|uniref:HK97 gp10 family phage protein n=1 Tax=Streptomyces sp. S.PB5 TaxID=3020844 RepID=UPI0025B12A6A|nr:HK97 gp10 family phage protein [Streptomyces sp. S.PB5]MDN3025677.1 HK97 gp10 family phage protein [Streptomyces sp. S.PB5]